MMMETVINNVGSLSHRSLSDQDQNTMTWKLSVWDRANIDPAILRVPIVVILFIFLWGTDIGIFEKFRVQYGSVLGMRNNSTSSTQLQFMLHFSGVLSVLYLIETNTCVVFEIPAEISITIFYCLLIIITFGLPFLYKPKQKNKVDGGTILTNTRKSFQKLEDEDEDKDFDISDDTANLLTSISDGDAINMTSTSSQSSYFHFYYAIIENRSSFFHLLHKCIFPGKTISFSEIVFADALTSLSKVFKDIGVTIITIFAYIKNENVVIYHEEGMLLIAFLASIPALIRVRQCWVQFIGANEITTKIAVALNIIKYCTAFPPIWLTASASLGFHHPMLPAFIVATSVINTVYSYIWDIMMDWGLIQISINMNTKGNNNNTSSSSSNSNNSNNNNNNNNSNSNSNSNNNNNSNINRTVYFNCLRLRPLCFYPTYYYVFASIINLVLRFGWMANQLSVFQDLHASQLILIIEVSEVFRRSIWNIFRVEWEIINKTRKERNADKCDDEDPEDYDYLLTEMSSSSSSSSSNSSNMNANKDGLSSPRQKSLSMSSQAGNDLAVRRADSGAKFDDELAP
jgi:hypothetical protein